MRRNISLLLRRVSAATESKAARRRVLGVLQLPDALGLARGDGLQAHLRLGELHAQRLDAPRAADMAEQGAEQHAGKQCRGGDDVDEGAAHRLKCAR